MRRSLDQLPRVALSVAALTAVAALAAAWHFHGVAEAAAVRATDFARQNAELRFSLRQAQEQGEQIAARLAEADTQLGSAKTRATATETRSVQLSRELTSVRASLGEREQREVSLLSEIEALRREAAAAQAAAPRASQSAQPATPTFDPSPFNARIAALEAQLVQVLTRALAEPLPSPPAEPSAIAAAQIVEVGSSDAFIVIDGGLEHGLRSGDLCAVQRDGVEIARGRLADVRGRFAIAHILPGSLKGKLQTGDIVLLAN